MLRTEDEDAVSGRLVWQTIWLAASVGIVLAIATATIIKSWADGVSICHTWLSITRHCVGRRSCGPAHGIASPAEIRSVQSR